MRAADFHHGLLVAAVLASLPLLAVAPPAAALEPPPSIPSLVGERLEFRIRWGLLTAGLATLEVERAEDGGILLRATARTLPWLDAFYPVRDRIEARLDAEGRRALRYEKQAKEGRRPERTDLLVFDAGRGLARLTRDGAERPPLAVPAGVWDPLSCFYAYRALELPGDETAHLDVSDGKRLVAGTVTVLRRERVETPAGAFDAVVVEPDIEGIGGIFKKSPGARILIWLTDDERRLPVRMQSEVKVGHFVAELTAVTPPASSQPDAPAR